MSSTNKLIPFTLKLSGSDKKRIKLLCAMDNSFQYQYQILDSAICWAIENKESLYPIANPRDGTNSSYYLSIALEKVQELEDEWNCNSTRALYTALINYLKFKENEFITPSCSGL